MERGEGHILITIFKYAGETDSTCSWLSKRDQSSAILHIFRWRVPEPVPQYIEVGILSRENFIVRNFGGKEKYSLNPARRVEDIVWNVVRFQVKNNSSIYVTEENDSPFERIDIPDFLLRGKEDEEKLQVSVKWLREKDDHSNILIPIR
jgi:hypothetical protein